MESKEQIMSTSAAKKKTQADAVPQLAKNWSLRVDAGFPAPLAGLDQLQISSEAPEPTGTGYQIFGRVTSTQPTTTAFAIEKGSFSPKVANILEVSFILTVDGNSYAFVGLAQGSSMKGCYAPLFTASAGRGVDTEEGSWSAQAQPGPGEEEEEEKKHHGKHKNRSAR
jgi:hypothetical protein